MEQMSEGVVYSVALPVAMEQPPAPSLTSQNAPVTRRTVSTASRHSSYLLSPTQSLVCQTITRFGQASTSQLRSLHYVGTVYGTKTRSNRHLKALSERGLVRRIPHRLYGYQQGSGEYVYCPPESMARTPNLHTLDITGLYVALHAAVPEVVFLPEPWAPTDWSGHKVTPDAFIQLSRTHYFCEIDRSSESPSVISAKMNRYVNAYKHMDGGIFPFVLWIAHDTNRLAVLRREASKKAVPTLFSFVLYEEAADAIIKANN